ncbi:MAG: ferrous iron transport protein A [Candidatus Marinimicrobia bacterium]|jgi:ferrous iron transport protein A|nr:ferrous iron transport protein A [Candidatus Neomarinimicrobiota bacterium]
MKYKILKIAKSDIRKKLLAFGMTPYTIVEVIRVAPLGDPIEVMVRGCFISIRASEWDTLTVEET